MYIADYNLKLKLRNNIFPFITELVRVPRMIETKKLAFPIILLHIYNCNLFLNELEIIVDSCIISHRYLQIGPVVDSFSNKLLSLYSQINDHEF